MKLTIYSHTPIAGAPWQQFQCLKKYGPSDLKVRFIQNRNQYRDGRIFPKDLLFSDPGARQWMASSDVIHLHNYLPPEIKPYVNPNKQKIVSTLHSVPRQGNWQEVLKVSHSSYCIRQPMQMREYCNTPTLPNMFDIWWYCPISMDANRFSGKINIVYCPTNKHPDNVTASKGYDTVMPCLKQIVAERKEVSQQINLISFSGVEYFENLRLKSQGHITIDDICGATFHLTSIEGCCTGQAVLTSCPKDWGYPFTYTTLSNIKEKLDYFLDNRDKLAYAAKVTRQWVEENWNPKIQVNEFLRAYGYLK